MTLNLGDGCDGLLGLEAGSASLVLVDPPFGATRARWDRPLDWLRWWDAIDHALAPGRVAVVFATLRAALKICARPARRFAYDLVWKKNRASGHLNARRAPLRAHELILVFGDSAREAGCYEPQLTYGHAPMNAATRVSKSELYGRETVTSSNAGQTHRYQTSVLSFKSVANDTAGRIHPTQKPVELLRWLVRAYSRADELVVDPCAGSGATLQAARLEGRRAVGWENDPDIYGQARAWLDGTDSPLFAAKVTGG